MISYAEYKKIVLSIMNDVYESEKQRRNAARRLKTELNKLREPSISATLTNSIKYCMSCL